MKHGGIPSNLKTFYKSRREPHVVSKKLAKVFLVHLWTDLCQYFPSLVVWGWVYLFFFCQNQGDPTARGWTKHLTLHYNSGNLKYKNKHAGYQKSNSINKFMTMNQYSNTVINHTNQPAWCFKHFVIIL